MNRCVLAAADVEGSECRAESINRSIGDGESVLLLLTMLVVGQSARDDDGATEDTQAKALQVRQLPVAPVPCMPGWLALAGVGLAGAKKSRLIAAAGTGQLAADVK